MSQTRSIDQEIEELSAKRRGAAGLQVVSLVILMTGWIFGLPIILALGNLGLIVATFKGYSRWQYLRLWRRPNYRVRSIEQLAEEEVLAKHGLPADFKRQPQNGGQS